MPANIIYRASSTPTIPTVISVKNLPLTNLEMDANLKSLSNDVDTKVTRSGDTMTGSLGSSPTAGVIAVNTIGSPTFQVVGAGAVGDAAYMQFNRVGGAFSVRFGIDTDNKLKVGGSSMGNFSYSIYHEGFKPVKADVGLGNVDNTSDANKPVSTLQAASIATKSDTTTTTTKTSSTGASLVSGGTTVQRPTLTGSDYGFRFSTTINSFEGWNGTAWGSVGGGATGAAGDTVFVENSRTVNTSYSISVNKSASMVGPLVVATGQSITVQTNQRLVVL